MSDELCVVELQRLPVDVHRRAQEHGLTLQRELALVHAADQLGNAPQRLLWLSQQLGEQYAAFGGAPQSALDEAIEARRPEIDLRYVVPRHAADAAEQLGAVLDEVDQHCIAGDLLTLVTPPEGQSYRRWFLGEFIAQIRDGAAPSPWALPAAPASTSVTQTPASGIARSAVVTVDDDLDLQGAARIRGTIAELLERGVVDLTLDLARCAFIDSVGISLLLTTQQRLQQSGGNVVVTNVAGPSRRTLETTGVYDLLTRGS